MQNRKTDQKTPPKGKWLPIIVLVVTVFLYYGNTIKNGYSLDDDLVTTTDNSIHERVEKGISAIPEIFTTHYVTNKKQRYDYRPFATSSFAIEHQFFGNYSVSKRASISHLINVVIYVVVVLLVYLLVYKMLPEKNWKVPFVAALLFLIHPIHSEVVNNIKCRDELMVFVFGLMAALFLFKYIDAKVKKWWYLLIVMSFMFAAILSKSTGLIFIVVIPLMVYFFRDVNWKKLLTYFGLLLLTLVLTRILQKGVLPETQIRDLMFFENPLAYSDSFSDRVPMFFYTNFFYLKMMLFPAPLVYYYGYDQIPIADWSYIEVWVGVLFVVVGTIASVLRIKRKEVWSFGILFFLFGIGGAANLLFPAVGIVGERFAFIASFGLIFIVAYYSVHFLEKVKSKNGKYLVYAIGFGVVLISFTHVTNRNKDWKSRFSLYGNDIKHLSKSAKAHSLLGTEYTMMADSVSRTPNSSHKDYISYIDSAISEFTACVDIYDGYYNAANNAGALYFTRKKNYYKAKPLFKHAIDYKSDYIEALFNYGGCFNYDVKGVKELQMILEKSIPDSLITTNNVADTSLYLLERKAAFAMYMIKNEVRQTLSNVNVNMPNWRNVIVYQVMLSFNTHLDIEQGLLKSNLDVVQYEQAVKSYINNSNKENIQGQLQMLMSFTESTLFQELSSYIYQKSIQDKEYIGSINVAMRTMKSEFVDSSAYYWNKSLEADPTYYYAYKSLSTLYINEGDFDGVLEVNTRAVENGGFSDNTEYYVNIGNVYNARLQYDVALDYMGKAIGEIDRYYNEVLKDDNIKSNTKQFKLNDLISRKKQILGFMSKIYYDNGDQENSQKYYNLQMSI